jgi:hypothetical protein
MPELLRLDPDFSPMRAVASGAAAALTYLGAMYVDMAVTGSGSDDLLLVGLPLSRDPQRARLLGFLGHTGFGIVVGLVYGALGRRRLRGPNWARGAEMLMVENTALWPLTFPADRLHPGIRAGQIPPLNRPVPVAQQILRHLVFGIVLGLLYGKGRRSYSFASRARSIFSGVTGRLVTHTPTAS